ncbi:MAG: hypothetical protein QXG08_01115 [Candidatus Methanomethyliaceae archaeon]
MVKVVQILWFETISPLHQPFIDTPIGPVTVRQFIFAVAGAAVGYFIYGALPAWLDPFLRGGVGAVPFIFAILTASRKVKTVPPEKYLLYLLLGRGRRRRKGEKKKKEKGERREKKGKSEGKEGRPEKGEIGAGSGERVEGANRSALERSWERPGAAERRPAKAARPEEILEEPETPSVTAVVTGAAVEVPEDVRRVLRHFVTPARETAAFPDALGRVEVFGQLRNPKTGAPMPNTTFYASIGGTVLSGQSDERGIYKFRFYPQIQGAYYVLVAVRGFDSPVDSVLVNVKTK